MRFSVALDCLDPKGLIPFWQAALGYTHVWSVPGFEVLQPGEGEPPGPVLILQQVPEPRSGKNRMHLDIHPPLELGVPALVERLQSLGGEVVYHDEFVPELPKFGLTNTSLEDALDGADIALIVTAHPGIDHKAVATQLPTVDYRGVTRTTRAASRPPMQMAVLPQRDNEIEPTEVAA